MGKVRSICAKQRAKGTTEAFNSYVRSGSVALLARVRAKSFSQHAFGTKGESTKMGTYCSLEEMV